MNFSTLMGFMGSLTIFIASIAFALHNPKVLLDSSSIFLVFGGTCTSAFVCFRLEHLVKLIRVVWHRLLGKNKRNYQELIDEIYRLARARRQGKQAFEQATHNIKDHFLREGAEILFWADAEIEDNEIRDILETRADTHFAEYTDDAETFNTLSKFPPAFGLMGTTLGMIALLQSLGGENSIATIGPAMAVALITTFYGVAIANLVLIPIAENLSQQTKEDRIARLMVVESLMLIHAQKPPRYVREKALSFLIPSKRKKLDAKSQDQHNMRNAA